MRWSGRSLLAVAPGVVVLAGVCAACTATPTPAPTTPATSTSSTSSPTTSASPTTSQTSGPPTSTQALTPLQKEAIAAVDAFYAAANAGADSRSSAALRELYVQSCAPCESIADRIDDLRAKNLTVEGSNARALDVSAMQGTDKGIGVQGTLRSDAVKLRDAGGNVVDSFSAVTRSPVVWLLRREGSAMLVVDIRGN